MRDTRFRRSVSKILTALLLLAVLTLVVGCSVRLNVVNAPTGVDVKSTYAVTIELEPRMNATAVRGVLAFRYPGHWEVASVSYAGAKNGTATFSPNIASYFGHEWEAAHGSRLESVTWQYVWWAGYTTLEDWVTDDHLTVTIVFNTRYKTATWDLSGYLLDFITGYTQAVDVETVTDAFSRTLWESGGAEDALGQRLNVPVQLFAFTDVRPPYRYHYATEQVAHRGIVDGYHHADTTREFRPDASLWRAQFCKMVVKGLTIPLPPITEDEDAGIPFTDLGPDDPYDLYPHEYVARAWALGITNGTTPSTFSPWKELTRCQAVTMVVRAVSIYWEPAPADPPPEFVSTWGNDFDPVHGPAAWRAEHWGLLDNIPLADEAADPWAPIPRGEMAQLLWNALVMITPPHYLH